MLIHTLRRVVAWALGLVLVAGTATAFGVAMFPLATGGSALAVLSGSMSPGLPVGAMAFVRPVDPADVRPGDVITFQHPESPTAVVTHRVLAVDDAGGSPVFTTQGDANEDPDVDPVPAAALEGRLWFGVPSLGRASALLHSPKGAGLLVVLVCAVIAASPGPRPGTGAAADDSEAEDAGLPRPRRDADLVDAADARTVVMAPVAGGSRQPRYARPPVPPPLGNAARPSLG